MHKKIKKMLRMIREPLYEGEKRNGIGYWSRCPSKLHKYRKKYYKPYFDKKREEERLEQEKWEADYVKCDYKMVSTTSLKEYEYLNSLLLKAGFSCGQLISNKIEKEYVVTDELGCSCGVESYYETTYTKEYYKNN
jgi:hypothetical protein